MDSIAARVPATVGVNLMLIVQPPAGAMGEEETQVSLESAKSPELAPVLEMDVTVSGPQVLETSRDSEIAVRNNPFLYSGCRPWFRGLDSGLLGPA
jgi:hypothetical protein